MGHERLTRTTGTTPPPLDNLINGHLFDVLLDLGQLWSNGVTERDWCCKAIGFQGRPAAIIRNRGSLGRSSDESGKTVKVGRKRNHKEIGAATLMDASANPA